MPVTADRIEKLEQLLHRSNLPVQKKKNLDRNVNRIVWVKDNFDIRNADHPKRDEIMALIEEILTPD
jgi:hypothetical protein